MRRDRAAGSCRHGKAAGGGRLPDAPCRQRRAPAGPGQHAAPHDRRPPRGGEDGVHLRGCAELPLPLCRRSRGVRGIQPARSERRDRPRYERGVDECSVDELGRLGFLGPALGADMEFYILMLANLIGAASLAGWLVAWAKLDGLIKKPWRFRGQRFCNALVLLATLAIGTHTVVADGEAGFGVHRLLFPVALAFRGVLAVPVGGIHIPGVIFLFNNFTRPSSRLARPLLHK